ncbi:hypothetical protein [Streptomyces sp. NRRL B-24720]|uniref:hypothetical protein n=1 Tax=Streptomyces sp. NRRL B-24720 TaxID=1476876 RepID=UPI000AF09896|nr:hypothetical protein [Streptomyces sp. NRRL B-24720]
MIEGGSGATAPYTDAARARLVMAYEACELADLARAFVPIGEHELNPDGTSRWPGTVLADAARVVGAAQRFFEAAAVFERMGGADWQVIGDVLEVSARTAQVRFAMAETAFRELLSPERGPAAGEAGRLRAYVTPPPRKRGGFSLDPTGSHDGQALTAAETGSQRTTPLHGSESHDAFPARPELKAGIPTQDQGWPGNRWKWPSISTTGFCATRTATAASTPRRLRRPGPEGSSTTR